MRRCPWRKICSWHWQTNSQAMGANEGGLPVRDRVRYMAGCQGPCESGICTAVVRPAAAAPMAGCCLLMKLGSLLRRPYEGPSMWAE